MFDETVKAVELMFKVTGLDKMAPNIAIIEKIRKTTGETASAAHKMGNAVAHGVHQATAALDKMNERLQSAMSMMKSMVSLGSMWAAASRIIRGGSSAEETSLSLAGTINSFGLTRNAGSDPLSQFRAARGEAEGMMQTMRDMAAVLPGEARDYVSAIRGELTPLLSAGLNLQEIARWSSNATAVGLAYGIDSAQGSRDMARIIKGHGTAQERMWREVVQPQLQNQGVTDAQWKAKTDRQRVDMLGEMFGGNGGFGPMLREFENTWGSQIGTFQSNMDDIIRDGGAQVFEELKGILRDINSYVGSMREQFAKVIQQAGQFASLMKPLIAVGVGSHAVKSVTGKGLGGITLAYMNAIEGKPTAAFNWLRSRGGSAVTHMQGAGRAAGGFLSALGGAASATGQDIARVGTAWGRAVGPRISDAFSRGGKAASAAFQGVLARGAASAPGQWILGAAGAVRGGAKSLRDRVVSGLWEARFQATQALSPAFNRLRGVYGSARSLAGSAWGRVRDTAVSGLWEARFRAGRALGPVGTWLSSAASKGAGFLGGAARLLPRVLAQSSLGRALSSAAGDVASVAGRAAQRFGFLGEALKKTGSYAMSFGGKAGESLRKILPYAGSLVGSFAKLGIYAVLIAILVTGVREIMKNVEAQARIMGSVDRLMGSLRVLFYDMAAAFGPEFQGMFKDILPKTIAGIVDAFTWIFTNAQALGRYLGDLAYDIANPTAPRTRHNFDVYQAEVRGEMLREAQRYNRERRQADRSAGGRGNSRASQPQVHQDFRGSHFHVTQHYAPGYDPDRIAAGFTDRLAALGRRRLQSNMGPMFSMR